MGAGTGFVEVAAGVIPVVLLVLAAQDQLAFVRPQWRRGGRLHAIALLIGGLIVGEALALGAVHRGRAPSVLVGYLMIVICAALGMVAWGIGWTVWNKYATDVPADGTVSKKAFYAIGLLTLAGLTAAIFWTLI